MTPIEVRAAGGVVARRLGDRLELLLVHRPKYDDWSLPKGKLDAGESFEEAALREVLEETGLTCRLEESLSTIHYLDSRGRLKEVRYWLMSVESGEIERRLPDAEVDQICWNSPAAADELASYERDREILEEAVGILSRRNP